MPFPSQAPPDRHIPHKPTAFDKKVETPITPTLPSRHTKPQNCWTNAREACNPREEDGGRPPLLSRKGRSSKCRIPQACNCTVKNGNGNNPNWRNAPSRSSAPIQAPFCGNRPKRLRYASRTCRERRSTASGSRPAACNATSTWADSPTACIWWKSPATGSTGVTSSSKNRAVSLIHRRFRTKEACEKA